MGPPHVPSGGGLDEETAPLAGAVEKGKSRWKEKELGGIPGKGSYTQGNKVGVILLFGGHSKESDG